MIHELNDLVEAHGKQHLFQFKRLEQIRGYLCHMAMTYDLLFSFLKGFHLTLCAHLPKRD